MTNGPRTDFAGAGRLPIPAVIAGALAVIFLCLAVLGPGVRNVTRRYTTWQAQEARLAAAVHAEADLARLSAERARLTNHAPAPAGLLLADLNQMSVVLGAVQETATATGVGITRFQPLEPDTTGSYPERMIRVEAAGHFHALGRFVSRIERTPHLIGVRALALSAPPDAPGALRAEVLLHVVASFARPTSR